MNKIGQAMHNLFATEIINNCQNDSHSTAARIIERFGVGAYLEPKDAVSYTNFFVNYLKSAFKPLATYAEYPIENFLNTGQLVKGWIDVLMNTNDGWVILDHKFTGQITQSIEPEVIKYSGQLLAYKNAVEATTKNKVVSSWIHYPNVGLLYQIKI